MEIRNSQITRCSNLCQETLNRFSEQLEDVEVFFDVFDVIQKIVSRKFYLQSIHLNIQHKGADEAAHVDADNADDLTIMMMPNPVWKPDWEEIRTYEYGWY